MEVEKIKELMERYYSGDILPDEYNTLKETLLNSNKLTPELEIERKAFAFIDSWEPAEPIDLDRKISQAIQSRKKQKLRHKFVYLFSSAAAVLILCTIGFNISKYRANMPKDENLSISSTNISIEKNETEISNNYPANPEANQISTVSTGKVISQLKQPESEEIIKAGKTIDDALMDILLNIQISQNEAIETIENIEINNSIDTNII